MSSEQEIVLPDIGDFDAVEIVEILVSVGERIEAEQSLLILESDKASIDIPSPRAGVIKSLKVKAGDRISQGSPLLVLEVEHAGSAAPAAAPPATEPTQPEAPPEAESAPAPRAPGESEQRKAPVLPRPEDMARIAQGRTPHASPAVRRFARELGVELAQAKGSGRKGRILKDDVQSFVKHKLAATTTGGELALPRMPEVDFSKFGAVEAVPLSRIKRISGSHLHRAWLTVPHVTQFDQADITELEQFRKSQREAAQAAGVKLTMLAFVLKAVAYALAEMPILKASLSADGEQLIHKHYCHLGVAVDTPNGLVVPVVRDVDRKGVFDLARELMSLSAKARDGKLLPADLQGGVFSISSLGGIGGTAFTPIVNAPEVAILGLSRAEFKPVWDGQQFVPRLLLPLSLSYDHRVVDGADGVRFTTRLARLLADVRQLLL